MSLKFLSKAQLRKKLIKLQDDVAEHLEKDSDVDSFLDQTDLFDEWEEVLPEAEFPIFVITILNNISREAIIASIVDSIGKNDKLTKTENKKVTIKNIEFPDHPFS